MADQQSSINFESLARYFGALIRRIIREELPNVVKDTPGVFSLNPDISRYKDMEKIRERNTGGQIKLHTHNEVWGE